MHHNMMILLKNLTFCIRIKNIAMNLRGIGFNKLMKRLMVDLMQAQNIGISINCQCIIIIMIKNDNQIIAAAKFSDYFIIFLCFIFF